MFSPIEYKILISELKKAYENNDIVWFNKYYNKYQCKKLISYWTEKHKETNDEKYANGKSFLKHLLKMSRNREKWELLIKEKLDSKL